MFTVHKVQIGNHEAWEIRTPDGEGIGQFKSPEIPRSLAALYSAHQLIKRVSAKELAS